jgi:hypothetical protein
LTVAQLAGWGAKHHQLIMGEKPQFDLYICDKSVNANAFFRENPEFDEHEQWK